MRYPREKNVLDTKWAHPEIVEDNTYTIRHNFDLVLANVGKTPEEVYASNEMWRKPLFDLFEENSDPREKEEAEWSEIYTEHGCDKEPEAKVRMLVRMPKKIKEKEKLPGILYLHGGGIMGGTPETCVALGSKLLLESKVKAVAVFPEYRTAPCWKYPAAVNDCEAAYLWMIENAEKYHIDTDKLIITGGSSGGHMTLSLGFRLKDNGYHGHMPRGLISMVPVMDDTANNDSFSISFEDSEGNLDGWDKHGTMLGFRLWLGDRFGDPSLPPEAVPNRAKPEDVKGYPPVWLPCCAEFDGARDSSYIFANMLNKAGVFCDFHVWGGCSHLLTGGQGDTELSKRIWSTIEGALKDAIKYDFRRSWLNE